MAKTRMRFEKRANASLGIVALQIKCIVDAVLPPIAPGAKAPGTIGLPTECENLTPAAK